MKKIILISLISFLSLFANAETFIFNDIYYVVGTVFQDSGTAYVDHNYYFSGVAIIADTVEYNGRKYPVTGMVDDAFLGNKDLTGVTIPNTVTTIAYRAFYGCENLKSVTMPNSLISIGNFAFYKCIGLTSVEIPNSTTSIGSCAFYECKSFTSITIPYSVTTIGSNAFDYCENLLDVTCLAITPPKMESYRCLYPAYYMAILHVPERSEEAYKATDWWNCFLNIEGDAEDNSNANYHTDKCDTNSDGEVNIADVNKIIDRILSK